METKTWQKVQNRPYIYTLERRVQIVGTALPIGRNRTRAGPESPPAELRSNHTRPFSQSRAVSLARVSATTGPLRWNSAASARSTDKLNR